MWLAPPGLGCLAGDDRPVVNQPGCLTGDDHPVVNQPVCLTGDDHPVVNQPVWKCKARWAR